MKPKGKIYLMVDDDEVILQTFVIRIGKHLHAYTYTPDQHDEILERIKDHGLRDDYPLKPEIAAQILTAMERFHQEPHGSSNLWRENPNDYQDEQF
tara:strand:+ start:1781 stop:2068 length:288 start_codon:yes stop_codon:yes gene_type:complete